MKVPFCDLSRLTREVSANAIASWQGVLDRCEFVGGATVDALESDLSTALAARHVIACANGTDALVLSLLAQGVGTGHVVALPALTFWATYEAVVAVGATPLLLDVDEDQQLDLDALMAAHAARPVDAVVLVHLFGWCSPRLAEIRAWCRARSIALIEDGAQAYGVEVDVERGGRSVFAGAMCATLSFYPAKVIGGPCDGGAVMCGDETVAARLRSFRNHGRGAHGYMHERTGVNSRMGGLAASYLRHVVTMDARVLDARRAALDFYRDALDGMNGFRVHMPPTGVVGNGYLAVVTSDRMTGEEMAGKLTRAGIGSARTYPCTVADQPPARGARVFGTLGRARSFCQRVVNLPLFYGITRDECEAAVGALFA